MLVAGVISAAGTESCVIPFEYKNKIYDQCTAVDNEGEPWCATTNPYQSGQWIPCSDGE